MDNFLNQLIEIEAVENEACSFFFLQKMKSLQKLNAAENSHAPMAIFCGILFL